MNDNLALLLAAILTFPFVFALIFAASFLAEFNEYVSFVFVLAVCVGMMLLRFKV